MTRLDWLLEAMRGKKVDKDADLMARSFLRADREKDLKRVAADTIQGIGGKGKILEKSEDAIIVGVATDIGQVRSKLPSLGFSKGDAPDHFVHADTKINVVLSSKASGQTIVLFGV